MIYRILINTYEWNIIMQSAIVTWNFILYRLHALTIYAGFEVISFVLHLHKVLIDNETQLHRK